MGTVELLLCVFVGHFIAAQSVINEQDAMFFQALPGFFEDIVPFPFKRNFDFTPYDTIFSSWQTRTPDFHMLAELPPIVNVPKIEVFCDESKLTLLVDKRSNGVTLTGEEIQLGDGCYSNGALPNQFVFTYSLDECGTTLGMQKGLEMFTNSLHLNLKKPPTTWWQTPSTVHVSCIPKRSYYNPNFFVSTAIPEKGKIFNIKAMNPFWTSTAESNIYKRGQVVNLQVSAKTRPEQQLFIQSCFVSASPEPQTRPRHAVIMNKGCTAPFHSPYAIVQFVSSKTADVVNFVLNTSYLISELYIHCSVLISDQGVTFGSKSCNYNVIQSRWEDLSGTVAVCECCSSKCKGLSVKHLPEDTKAIVSTGPLVIVDKDVRKSPEPPISEPQETSSTPVTYSMQSDGAETEDAGVSGTHVSRSKFFSPPQGVVVVSQDPLARLTLWVPGQVQDAEQSDPQDNLTVQLQASGTVSNDLPEPHPSSTDQESLLNTSKIGDQSANELGSEDHMWDLDFLPLVNGFVIPPHVEKTAIAEESQGKRWFGRSGMFGTEAQQEAETTANVLNQNNFDQMRDELAQSHAAVMPQEGPNDARPIIRSKLQFSKGADGSQTLSYEEDMVTQQEENGVIRRSGMDGIKREARQKGLFSTFLDLLRRMDKAE
ncbi:zona pellucida protein C [Siniperca chuatsi]|uniref:zona pellucida protein C n=1 Tax=Siniperca chuatsi TaxID=119488 RepID=UPI001CE031A5|nr:zona pellucida protein C [Siniperca chuatsi]